MANDSNQKAQLIRVSRTSTDEFQQQQNQGLEDSVGKKINELIIRYCLSLVIILSTLKI